MRATIIVIAVIMVVILGISVYSSILDTFLKPRNIIDGGDDSGDYGDGNGGDGEDDDGVDGGNDGGSMPFSKARDVYPDNVIDV